MSPTDAPSQSPPFIECGEKNCTKAFAPSLYLCTFNISALGGARYGRVQGGPKRGRLPRAGDHASAFFLGHTTVRTFESGGLQEYAWAGHPF